MKIKITDSNGAKLYTAGKYLTENIEVSIAEEALPPATRINRVLVSPTQSIYTLYPSYYAILGTENSKTLNLKLDSFNEDDDGYINEFSGEIRVGTGEEIITFIDDIIWMYNEDDKISFDGTSFTVAENGIYMYSILGNIGIFGFSREYAVSE